MTRAEMISKWIKAEKANIFDGFRCVCKYCKSTELAILDDPDDPGVICMDHYLYGERCKNGCNSPQIKDGLCRQCIIKEEVPIKVVLYKSSSLSRAEIYGEKIAAKGYGDKSNRGKGVKIRKFNPFNVHQI